MQTKWNKSSHFVILCQMTYVYGRSLTTLGKSNKFNAPFQQLTICGRKCGQKSFVFYILFLDSDWFQKFEFSKQLPYFGITGNIFRKRTPFNVHKIIACYFGSSSGLGGALRSLERCTNVSWSEHVTGWPISIKT